MDDVRRMDHAYPISSPLSLRLRCANNFKFLDGGRCEIIFRVGTLKIILVSWVVPLKKFKTALIRCISLEKLSQFLSENGSLFEPRAGWLFAYAKTMAQISCTVTAQLICAFLFTT